MDTLGISRTGSFRDDWMSQVMSGEKPSGSTAAPSGTTGPKGGKWDVVFEDEADKGVSVDDFLNLMVAQLKNQDFMNPVDDTQYVTQLAQFATMSQMQELAANMKNNFALSLAGKNVTCAKFTVSGDMIKETGVVTKISLVNNSYEITVNGKNFKLNQIMEINGSGSTGGTGSTTNPNTGDREYLLSLMDKFVSIKHGEETITGLVTSVSSADGKLQVFVNGNWYPLDEVVGVQSGPDKPDDNGEVKPDGNGEVKPDGNGEVKPDGNGEVKPDGNGEVKPDGNGEVKPDGNGEVKPDGNGDGEVIPKPDGDSSTVTPNPDGDSVLDGSTNSGAADNSTKPDDTQV